MNIARVWHGWTSLADADAYEQHFNHLVIPILNSISGFRSAELRRKAGDRDIEFVAVTRFGSFEAIKRFAGEDFGRAVVAPEARALLLRFDERCDHYLAVTEIRRSD